MVVLINHTQIKFKFWLSIPESPRLLVFWFHGSTTASPQDLAVKHPLELEQALHLLPEDCIFVTQLSPKVTLEESGKVIDPQCLSLETLCSTI